MKHKHADVLNAIADGKIVQYKHEFIDWRDADLEVLKADVDPFTFHDYDWRIKPEPHPDIVRYLACDVRFDRYDVTPSKYDGDNLKLTFDGETGKLKSAEVL